MEKLYDQLKTIREKVESIDKNTAINTVSLVHHIERTEHNETRILFLERVFITLASVAVLGGIIKLLIS